MVNYKDLGLVNTRDMFAKAIKGGYAIPAFNFNNMEQMQAIIKAAVETKSPVILQVSKGARQYANATLLRYMAQGAVEYAKELGKPVLFVGIGILVSGVIAIIVKNHSIPTAVFFLAIIAGIAGLWLHKIQKNFRKF